MSAHQRSRPLQLVAMLLVTAVVAALLPSAAQAAKRHGVQRNYAGAAWASVPGRVAGYVARLRLDRAFVTDRRTGGFIGQTLWSTTNNSNTRFGRNKRSPYLSVSVTRGFRGRNELAIVVSQRNKNGRYFEGRIKGASVKQGEGYTFGTSFRLGGRATVSLGGDVIATAKGTGARLAGTSAYAGIESSSRHNDAAGRVEKLGFQAVSGTGVGLGRWSVGGGRNSRLIKRGPGRVGWSDKYTSLRNSFGD